jgi:hypothetical protein
MALGRSTREVTTNTSKGNKRTEDISKVRSKTEITNPPKPLKPTAYPITQREDYYQA